MQAIVAAASTSGKPREMSVDQVLRARQAQDDETELTAWAKQQSGLQSGDPAQAKAHAQGTQ